MHCAGHAHNGKWVKMKVAMDSGATIDVMPEGECAHIEPVPCTGQRKGKRLAAANNTPISHVGEKRIMGKTDGGDNIDWRFIAGNVKKALKSTATTCDEDKWVIHTKTGGWIVDVKTRKRIPMQREGNNYVVDVWVPVPEKSTGFTRPSAR